MNYDYLLALSRWEINKDNFERILDNTDIIIIEKDKDLVFSNDENKIESEIKQTISYCKTLRQEIKLTKSTKNNTNNINAVSIVS